MYAFSVYEHLKINANAVATDKTLTLIIHKLGNIKPVYFQTDLFVLYEFWAVLHLKGYCWRPLHCVTNSGWKLTFGPGTKLLVDSSEYYLLHKEIDLRSKFDIAWNIYRNNSEIIHSVKYNC